MKTDTSPSSIDKSALLEFEILKHVEETPRLNNRLAATKLGCSVKLAHATLSKMVGRGLLHVKKLHARRWDYFLTPKGIAEKARLTYEFLDFSMRFYQEARKASSRVCRGLAEAGKKRVAFIGSGDLAEIVYLGVKEWGLELVEVFDDNGGGTFLGHPVFPLEKARESRADAMILCLYDKKNPMSSGFLPEGVPDDGRLHRVFPADSADDKAQRYETADAAPERLRAVAEDNAKSSREERWKRFVELQKRARLIVPPKGEEAFIRRNMEKRAIADG